MLSGTAEALTACADHRGDCTPLRFNGMCAEIRWFSPPGRARTRLDEAVFGAPSTACFRLIRSFSSAIPLARRWFIRG